MKYLEAFNLFGNKLTTVEKICNQYGIENWELDSDGKIRINGDVNLSNLGLKKIPLNFSYVSGYFNCGHNQLTSLEGCPKEVGGHFYCYCNKLTSLEGCPKEVGRYFDCSNNQLTSLEGCPKEVGGSFYCSYNELTSLEGCPKKVGGNFGCIYNQLASLEGCPKEVGGHFYCYFNQIKNLAIDYRIDVGGDIYLGDNPLPREILYLNHEELHWLFKYGYEYWHLWHDGKLNLRWSKELKESQ